MDNQIQNTIDSMRNKSLELINQDIDKASDIKSQLQDLLAIIVQMQKGEIQFDQQIIKNYYSLAGAFYKSINLIRSHLPSPELLQK
jgi:hypothetical protein